MMMGWRASAWAWLEPSVGGGGRIWRRACMWSDLEMKHVNDQAAPREELMHGHVHCCQY